MGLRVDGPAVEFDHNIAGLQVGLVGGRIGSAGGDLGRGERTAFVEADAHDAAMQVLALDEARQNRLHVDERHGKADARIVPFAAGGGAVVVGRERHEQTQHSTADVDQRAAIVTGRHFGVGLNGPAPDAAGRTEHADRHVWQRPGERAPHGHGPLADLHRLTGSGLGHGQFFFHIDLQQHELARVVGGEDLGGGATTTGKLHQNRSRLTGKGGRAADDVPIGRDDQARRRSAAEDVSALAEQAANGFDAHHTGSNPIDGGFKGLLFKLPDVNWLIRTACGFAQQDEKTYHQQRCEFRSAFHII